MNWFERYGVVGGYFLLLLIMWGYAISDIKNFFDPNNQFSFAVSLFGLGSSLPFGYLISIFSQALYYHNLSGRQIHNEISEIIRNNNEFQGKINLRDDFLEAKNEAIITCWDRIGFERKSFKSLDSFATKRFAVISINKSLILATLLAPLCIVLCKIFLCHRSFKFNGQVLICLIFSASVIVIAILSNSKLTNQILALNKEIYSSRDFLTKVEERRLSFNQKMQNLFFSKIIPWQLSYLIIGITFLVCIFLIYVMLV